MTPANSDAHCRITDMEIKVWQHKTQQVESKKKEGERESTTQPRPPGSSWQRWCALASGGHGRGEQRSHVWAPGSGRRRRGGGRAPCTEASLAGTPPAAGRWWTQTHTLSFIWPVHWRYELIRFWWSKVMVSVSLKNTRFGYFCSEGIDVERSNWCRLTPGTWNESRLWAYKVRSWGHWKFQHIFGNNFHKDIWSSSSLCSSCVIPQVAPTRGLFFTPDDLDQAQKSGRKMTDELTENQMWPWKANRCWRFSLWNS